jgi:hypothetical protein
MVNQIMERLAKCSNAYSLNWYNIKSNGQQRQPKCKRKSLDSAPDETRTFEKGKIELAKKEWKIAILNVSNLE